MFNGYLYPCTFETRKTIHYTENNVYNDGDWTVQTRQVLFKKGYFHSTAMPSENSNL